MNARAIKEDSWEEVAITWGLKMWLRFGLIH